MSYLMKIKNQPWGKRLFSCHGHWQPLEYSMSPCVSWHPWNLKFLSKFARVIKRAKTLRKKLGFVPTYREGVGVKPVGTKSQLLPNKKMKAPLLVVHASMHYWLRRSMGFEKYKKWTKVDTCLAQTPRISVKFHRFWVDDLGGEWCYALNHL